MSDRFRTQEDVFRFLDIVESKGVGNLIPFPDDLLFHFFNKKTIIADTYLLDPVSGLKLYPRKSNNLVTTSVNTQLHVPKELVDYTLGFELSMDVYFDSATWDYSRHNWLCGRGNNTGFPSGMGAPGNGGNDFKCNWKNSGFSVVSMNSKPAGWYRVTMIVTPTTHQQKVQNLSTGEIFLGTAELNGTSTIGESVAFTLLSFGIDGYTAAYGSVGMNVSNVKITRGGATIFHLPLSEGNLAVVRDVISKTAYTLGFFTISAGWAKKADFSHYNFKNGFTLYKKDANPNIYVPNDSTGAEIPWTPVLGYVKGANYKGTTRTFNQCESKFKLDNTTVSSVLRCASAGASYVIGDYVYNSSNSRWVNTTTGAYIAFQGGTEWYWWNSSGTAMYYYGYAAGTPANVVTWFRSGGAAPAPSQLQSVLITSDLYNADVDHILFTEGTGVAKEFEIGSMHSEIVDSVHDRGHLYINSDSDKNFMLYKTDKGIDTPADLKIWKYVK